MKLRFFSVYNQNGGDSEPDLQQWDKESERWKSVNHRRVRYTEEEDAMRDKYMC